ncbi:MAG: hypothetical protein L0Y56_12980 [Nitrospira sp.]|nr:hypothetical protein [Nitrospira sp.]
MTRSQTGTFHEMKVVIDLMRRGYEVYRAVSGGAPCDFVAVKDGKAIRVEVTTGHRYKTKLNHPPKDPNKFDVLAIVEHDGWITYRPDLL